jgi:hypothetical protein
MITVITLCGSSGCVNEALLDIVLQGLGKSRSPALLAALGGDEAPAALLGAAPGSDTPTQAVGTAPEAVSAYLKSLTVSGSATAGQITIGRSR